MDIIHWTVCVFLWKFLDNYPVFIQLRICSDNTLSITDLYDVFFSIILSHLKAILYSLSPPCSCCFCQNLFLNPYSICVCIHKEEMQWCISHVKSILNRKNSHQTKVYGIYHNIKTLYNAFNILIMTSVGVVYYFSLFIMHQLA